MRRSTIGKVRDPMPDILDQMTVADMPTMIGFNFPFGELKPVAFDQRTGSPLATAAGVAAGTRCRAQLAANRPSPVGW